MNITILNCIPCNTYMEFGEKLDSIIDQDRENKYVVFNVKDMNIKYCIGCWGCWVKTPGRCIQGDDMPQILSSIMDSELVVFVSPIIMGFVSSILKKINDKMLPIIHPYLEICEGECHHRTRYDKYPKLALMLLDEKENASDFEVIKNVYKRIALNLKTELCFTVLSSGDLEGLKYEINNF